MTDEIPDDVVERALSTYWDADWTGACMDETYKARTDAMRAALRVAVEWEREQCARAGVAAINSCREDGESDLRAVRSRVESAIRALKETKR